EMGIDASGQHPKNVEAFVGQPFDVIVTTCDGAREHCPFFPGEARREHWSLPDPAAATGTEQERMEAFRSVAQQICERTLALSTTLEAAPQDGPSAG
ncbi:MAG: arsenate reductase ArsC, partial [bacterium]